MLYQNIYLKEPKHRRVRGKVIGHSNCSGRKSKLSQDAEYELVQVPKDCRTLLRTKPYLSVKSLAGGCYYYFGVTFWMKSLYATNIIEKI